MTTSRRNLDVVSDLDLREEPFDGSSARILTAQVQQEYVVRYGGPDSTPVDTTEFAPPRGRFLVGYLDVGPVVMAGSGCSTPARSRSNACTSPPLSGVEGSLASC